MFAILAFTQGHVVKTPSTDTLAAEFYRYGAWHEIRENRPVAIAWYTLALAYKPDARTASKLEGLYHILREDNLAEAPWQQVADAIPASEPDHWQAMARLAELEKIWKRAAEAYERGASLADKDETYVFSLREGMAWSWANEHGRQKWPISRH